MQTRWIAPTLALLLTLVLASWMGRSASADEDWEIVRFHADIQIEPDGAVLITEAIDVDFRGLSKHGIFREIPVRYDWDELRQRVYRLSDIDVRDAGGTTWKWEREGNDANERIRIGDPDREVSGPQSYRIRYRVRGALNGFDDHDELFWNVNGADWPVPARRVSALVRGPAVAVTRAACFQGPEGSVEPCQSGITSDGASFVATRPFRSGEQLTIVAAIPKGAARDVAPILEDKPRTIDRYFETTPLTVGATGAVLVGGLALVGRNWWRRGRDRRYLKRAALPEEGDEAAAPLFDAPTVVAEYEPPDRLRPAELGLILDERADTKDLTATIVDLAVRGYLRIEHVEKAWLLGKEDWRLVRVDPELPLQPYERELARGIFATGEEVLLSGIKGKVAPSLKTAQRALYSDAVARGWFTGDPDRTRQLWGGIGCALVVGGVALAYVLGSAFGFGLVALAVVVCGLVLLVTHSAMARRSARGSELLRRTLGFRRYMETAERHRAEFAEREGLFSQYLPYAIVFGCVERWARAFEGLDRAATAASGWYSGPSAFSTSSFSRELETFSSTVSSTIGHTPGSSGSSGFGGGSSGGGGGGGGGGSW